MMQMVLSHFRQTLIPCLALFLFLGVFVSVLTWIFRRGSSTFYQSLQNLPFEESNPVGGKDNV